MNKAWEKSRQTVGKCGRKVEIEWENSEMKSKKTVGREWENSRQTV